MAIKGELPKPEGTVTVYDCGPLNVKDAIIPLAKPVIADNILFNYGALFVFMGMDELSQDPLSEWLLNNQDNQISWLVLRNAFIENYPGDAIKYKVPWNRLLFLVNKKQWEGIKEYIGSLAIVDTQRKCYRAPSLACISLVDTKLYDSIFNIENPNTQVYLFGIDGSDMRYEPAYINNKLTFAKLEPRNETIQKTDKLLEQYLFV